MLELLIKILIEIDGKEKEIELNEKEIELNEKEIDGKGKEIKLKEKDTEFFLFFKSHFKLIKLYDISG